MTFTAFLLIVSSAMLHSTWNLLLKRARNGVASYVLMCLPIVLLWFHVQFWTPVDVLHLPWSFWGCLVASLAADLLYAFSIFPAYERMDMSIVYPMMRSLPIIFTMVITSALGLGARLSVQTLLGMFVVFVGCTLMPMKQFSDFKLKNYLSTNMILIVMIALGTTGYTIFDSQAMKVIADVAPEISKPIRSLTYYSTRCIALNITLWSISMSIPSIRSSFIPAIKSHGKSIFFAGICASGTYVLVLMAMNYVTNVSYVQVFRQLALPFGMLLAFVFLKEKCTPTKIAGITLIVLGLALTVL